MPIVTQDYPVGVDFGTRRLIGCLRRAGKNMRQEEINIQKRMPVWHI